MEGQFLRGVDFVLLEFFEEALVAQVQWVRMLPVVVNDFAESLDNFGIVDFDGEFAAGIEAARREIDGTNDGAGVIGEQHLAMKLQVFEFVNLDADVVEDAEAADAFGELVFFQLVGRAGHDVDLDAAFLGANQALDDDLVLIAFVLNKESVLGIVDEAGNAVATVSVTPDKKSLGVDGERLAGPIMLEAVDDLLDRRP